MPAPGPPPTHSPRRRPPPADGSGEVRLPVWNFFRVCFRLCAHGFARLGGGVCIPCSGRNLLSWMLLRRAVGRRFPAGPCALCCLTSANNGVRLLRGRDLPLL